jgi:hypothetical protein
MVVQKVTRKREVAGDASGFAGVKDWSAWWKGWTVGFKQGWDSHQAQQCTQSGNA